MSLRRQRWRLSDGRLVRLGLGGGLVVRNGRDGHGGRLAALLAGPSVLTPEQERWAEANTVLQLYGAGVFAFIEGRIITLARDGDEAGVDRWREIADRVARLQRDTLQ